MGHNSTLWRPSKDVAAQLRHGQEVLRVKGGATSGMTERAAFQRGRLAQQEEQRRHSEELAAQAEADRRMGQPHYGH